MYYCVAYDISNNRLRRRVSKWCRQAGLERLQRSVFIGRVGPARLAELEAAVRPLLPTADRFAVMPLDRETYARLLNASPLPLAGQLDKPLVYWTI